MYIIARGRSSEYFSYKFNRNNYLIVDTIQLFNMYLKNINKLLNKTSKKYTSAVLKSFFKYFAFTFAKSKYSISNNNTMLFVTLNYTNMAYLTNI